MVKLLELQPEVLARSQMIEAWWTKTPKKSYEEPIQKYEMNGVNLEELIVSII